MRRLRIVAASLLVVLASVFGASATVGATTDPPRIVIVVGPVGEYTDLYRSVGAAAAREGKRWTSDVVTIASPDATWPVVRQALQGASIVVYLGHGNGFPSRYGPNPKPSTQNGLGLNPIAGGDDSAHQYFGESFLADQVRLAPHAIVILSHLCYASGNAEPGLSEPTLAVARQRIDNYAAGWVHAGAEAVIADTFGRPETYIRALFGVRGSIADLWTGAPTFHDHIGIFPSTRSAGFEARMDPTSAASRFNRSLVWRPGLTSSQVIAGTGAYLPLSVAGALPPSPPSLMGTRVTVGAPRLAPGAAGRGLVAGTHAKLAVPIVAPTGANTPPDLQIGVRWMPLDRALPSSPAGAGPGVGTTPAAPVAADAPASVSPAPGAPAVGPSPMATGIVELPAPPLVDAVVPGAPDSVVTVETTKLSKHRLVLTVDLPLAPGRYRLVATIHAADGTAYDAASQALLAPVDVRVSPPLSVAYGVVPAVTLVAGAAAVLPVRLANDGSITWAARPAVAMDLVGPRRPVDVSAPVLIGHWVPLSVDGLVTEAVRVASPRLPPGIETIVRLGLVAPDRPGSYLLLIDLVSPMHGSLAAAGARLAEVRVTVLPEPTTPVVSPPGGELGGPQPS